MARTPERIAWTRENAAAEFGINPRTLGARLKQSGAKPDANGKWTTIQIATAVYGSLELARIRKANAEAEEVEKRNAESDETLVDVDDFASVFEKIYVEMVTTIKASKLTDDEKDQILNKLADLHVIKEDETKEVMTTCDPDAVSNG